MKKTVTLCIIIFSIIISESGYAQQLTDEWRLIKKTWTPPGEGKTEWIYDYDVMGKVTNIKYYQGKKLHSTLAAFVYNGHNLIDSYKESFSDGADTIQHFFEYDQQNRILSAKEVKFKKSGEKRNTLIQSFSYNAHKIIERRIRTSFGGKLNDEISYKLDEEGNIVSKTTIEDGKKSLDYIYGEYDSKPNPLLFTGAYFYTQLLPKQNCKEGFWDGDKSAETIFTYNPKGMLQNATITYTLDNRLYTHQHYYIYTQVKHTRKPAVNK